jgi:DNA-binding NtrC family response regulator
MKVLVVDDEPLVVWSIVKALETMRYYVNWALNGKEAIMKIKNNVYDLLITDYKMPDATGVEVIKVLKKVNSSAKVIVITAYKSEGELIESIKNNFIDRMIEKPYILEDVLKSIKEVCEKR